MNAEQPQVPAKSNKRRGVVLVAVLVVVVLLSLAGYQYSDMMLAQQAVSENAHRAAQARAFADSGIHYAAAILSNPESFNSILGGNPWNNPQAFQNISIGGDNGVQGYFSIIAPPDPSDTTSSVCSFGVMDEGAKINLNAVMKLDATGQQLHDMLVKLPNMTEDIANNIVAWMGSVGIQNAGAQSDYYMGLNPPYRTKGGPIDSIDELLLVKGVTRDLLYGADWNRNGVQDVNEVTNNTFDRGWSAFLTVHSREQNADPLGNAYVFLNNTDLMQLSTALANTDIGDDLAKFIIIYRQNAQTSGTTGQSQSLGGTIASLFGGGGGSGNSGNTKTVPGMLSSYQVQFDKSAKTKINSIFELIGAKVNVSTKDAAGKAITMSFASPLNDPTLVRDLLPKLYNVATLLDPAQSPEIPARININTAPVEVLAALPGLADTDIQKIIAAKPQMSASEAISEIFQTPAWLLTEAQLDPKKLQALDQYITTRTQVFRVQSVGYFDGKGPAIRVEAVVDTNSGRPRIIAWRNLSELGKGWNDASLNPNP